MKRQALARVTDEHVHKMKKHCIAIPGSFAADDIHDLRVEYKKMRSFLRLLQLEAGAGHLRLPQDVKALYQAAGKVRDLQLFIQHLPIAVPCFIEYRRKQLFHDKEALVRAIEQVDFKKALHSIYKALPPHLQHDTLKKFQDKKIATIHLILEVAEEENDLHEVRKQVKDIIYNNKLVGEKNSEEPLTAVAMQLGNFNDRCHALALLQLSQTEQLPPEEKTAIHQLQQTWAQEKAAEQQQLLQHLQLYQ